MNVVIKRLNSVSNVVKMEKIHVKNVLLIQDSIYQMEFVKESVKIENFGPSKIFVSNVPFTRKRIRRTKMPA